MLSWVRIENEDEGTEPEGLDYKKPVVLPVYARGNEVCFIRFTYLSAEVVLDTLVQADCARTLVRDDRLVFYVNYLWLKGSCLLVKGAAWKHKHVLAALSIKR